MTAVPGVSGPSATDAVVLVPSSNIHFTTPTTTIPSATQDPTVVLTTYPPTTYLLPTLTSWGTSPDGGPDFDLSDRVLQLIVGGSSGERIVRGFLMGVALGIILGGVLCCWVPCFGRRNQDRREQRRRERWGRQQQRRSVTGGQRQRSGRGVVSTDTETARGEELREREREQQQQRRSRPLMGEIAGSSAAGSCIRRGWDKLRWLRGGSRS
ncbi:hypothetical protein E4U43_001943 [Claviceps pusilla]|uniref:Transmembrane protein n=1 Tax=Claviceps pusilla TaxID=123648 RepID=A0A9P7N9G0_9HYPO|nr:hypothetical protein E4U43_001943 [Claviceps pusilla]